MDRSRRHAVLTLRDQHPAWGGRKLHTRLLTLGHHGVPSPITAILRRHGQLDATQGAQHSAWRRCRRQDQSRTLPPCRRGIAHTSAPRSAPDEHIKGVRRRYEFLFGLILNSGLRITEALGVRVRDVRVADGIAKPVRVIGKGNRERLVPLPKACPAARK